MKALRRTRSSSRARRNAASLSSSGPSTAAGSSILQWIRLVPGRKYGTALCGVVANGNHIIERLPRELIHGLGAVARNVHAEFPHYRDCFRPYMAGLCAGARNIKGIL